MSMTEFRRVLKRASDYEFALRQIWDKQDRLSGRGAASIAHAALKKHAPDFRERKERADGKD